MDYINVPYPDFVAALVKPGETILAEMTPSQAHLMHMAIGVAGETGELLEAIDAHVNKCQPLDRENVVEELGDLEFFVEGVRAELGLIRIEALDDKPAAPYLAGLTSKSVFAVLEAATPPATAIRDTVYRYAVKATIAGLQLLDVVKKHAIYQKPIDRKAVTASLVDIGHLMSATRATLVIPRDEVVTHNRIKLGEKRYPGMRYSNEAAQARADKA